MFPAAPSTFGLGGVRVELTAGKFSGRPVPAVREAAGAHLQSTYLPGRLGCARLSIAWPLPPCQQHVRDRSLPAAAWLELHQSCLSRRIYTTIFTLSTTSNLHQPSPRHWTGSSFPPF